MFREWSAYALGPSSFVPEKMGSTILGGLRGRQSRFATRGWLFGVATLLALISGSVIGSGALLIATLVLAATAGWLALHSP